MVQTVVFSSLTIKVTISKKTLTQQIPYLIQIESLKTYRNLLFIGTYGGSLYSYNMEKGNIKRILKGKFFTTQHSINQGDGYLLFGTLNGMLYTINLKNFKVKNEDWHYGEIYGIFIGDNEILISCEGGLVKYIFKRE